MSFSFIKKAQASLGWTKSPVSESTDNSRCSNALEESSPNGFDSGKSMVETPKRKPNREYGLIRIWSQDTSTTATWNQLPGHDIDVVAIHGVNGHAIRTWTHANGHFWLRDALPKALPGARIFSYGYDSTIAFSRSFANMNDYARRLLIDIRDEVFTPSSTLSSEKLESYRLKPNDRNLGKSEGRKIVFVCHSMGGLVVKRALLMAREEASQYGQILERTLGICFLATPHRGSDTAKLTTVLGNIINLALMNVKSVSGRFRTDILKGLNESESALSNLSAGFRNLTEHFEIASFYELKATFPFKRRIVDESSALLNLPNEEQIPINTDHREICRFHSESDKDYIVLLNQLLRMTQASSAYPEKFNSHSWFSPRTLHHPNSLFKIPYPSSRNFTGREEYLDWMARSLFASDFACLALYGLQGSGKTQVAIKFAEIHCSRYKGIFFVNASSQEALTDGLDKIHDVLKLDCNDESKRAAQVAKWFTDESNSPWLVVFDNADALDSIDLTNSIPRGMGHVIITTKDTRIEESDLVAYARRMDVMSIDESRQLLTARNGLQQPDDVELGIIDEIAKQLGYLPLALDSASAQVRHQRLSFATYLALFREKIENRKQFLRYRPTMSTYPEPIFVVLDNVFDIIKSQFPLAFSLLTIFSHLDRTAIKFEMLFDGLKPQWRLDFQGELNLQSPLQACIDPYVLNLLEDRIVFHNAIERLLSLSLIYYDDTSSGSPFEMVAMHPLVQEHVISRLSLLERLDGLFWSLTLVAQAFPSIWKLEKLANIEPLKFSNFDEYKNTQYYYLPHARTCCQHLASLVRLCHDDNARQLLSLKLRSGMDGSPSMIQHVCYFFLEANALELDLKERSYRNHKSMLGSSTQFLDLGDKLLAYEDDEYARILQLQSRIQDNYAAGNYEQSALATEAFLCNHYPGLLEQSARAQAISQIPLINSDLCYLIIWWAEDIATEASSSADYTKSHKLLLLCHAVNAAAPSKIERLMLDTKSRMIGKIFKDEGRWEDAARALQSYCENCVCKGTESEGWATADRAQCLLELNRNNEAEIVIRDLLRERKESASFCADRPFADDENDHNLLKINLAECHLRQGRLDVAETEWEAVLCDMLNMEIKPHYYMTRIFSIYCGLARIAHLQAKWLDAKKKWEKAVEYGSNLSPGNVKWGRHHFYVCVAILSLADTLYEIEDFGNAMTFKTEVVESGALGSQNRMQWMLGIGTYWLEHVEEKWNLREYLS